MATAPNLRWDVITYWLTQPSILNGLLVTLELTVIAMAIGVSLGALLAVMRLSANPVVSTVSWFYIWFFRGTPVLVQLFFWYNLQLILPHIFVGIPFTSIGWHADTLTVITPFLASILGLGLNEAAYMAEIVRAGIISVDNGQTEAAQALGMTRIQVMQRVVLPQAMRVIIPPTGNETISMLKTIVARLHHHHPRALLRAAAHRRLQLPDRRAAHRGQHLVHRGHFDPHLRPVLPRAALRQGRVT